MQTSDLETVAAWLRDPEVARWYLVGSTIDDEVEDLRKSVLGTEPTEALVVEEASRAIGWCQWYLCQAYPEHATSVDAHPGDVGIDYAIGDRTRRGRGVGQTLIAALVAHIRRKHPRAGIIADPESANHASRRVLEKNGFQLVDERPLPTEPTDEPMAIYRLAPMT
jgi:aminoglycoside 6'-N-acetyltransferase